MAMERNNLLGQLIFLFSLIGLSWVQDIVPDVGSGNGDEPKESTIKQQPSSGKRGDDWHALIPKDYDKSERPGEGEGEPTLLHISLTISRIHSVNEAKMEGSLPDEFLPESSVAQLSTYPSNEPKWSDVLITLQFNGSLRGFLVGRFSGYMPTWKMDFPLGIENLSTHCWFGPESGLLYLASLSTPVAVSTEVPAPSRIGLSIWRKTDDENSAFTALDQSEPIKRFSDGILGKIMWWRRKEKVCVVSMDQNEDLKQLVATTSQGIVLLYQTPTLRPLKIFNNIVLLVKKGNGGVTFVEADDSEDFGSELLREDEESETVATTSSLIRPSVGCCYIMEEEAEWVGSREAESDAWVVARMAGLLLYGWVKLGMGWAVGQPLEEVSRPSPHSLTLHSVHTTLRSLLATTPKEIFRKKLELGDYGEALDLAKTYSLDTDQIYKRRWEQSSFDKYSVKDFLAKISDESYALNECLTRTAPNPESWESLLCHGIQICESKDSSETYPGTFAEAENKLQYYLLILHTYEKMLGQEEFKNDVYIQMRVLSLVDLALLLIKMKRFDWIPLLSGHEALRRHWLAILFLIPEVTPLHLYSHLLPLYKENSLKNGVEGKAPRQEEYSWLEGKGQAQRNEWTKSLEKTDLYTWYPELGRVKKEEWDLALINDWMRSRLTRIEELSGIPEDSLVFARCVVERGFSDLESERKEMEAFSSLSYGCGDLSLCLKQFRSLEPQSMIRRITSRETGSGENLVGTEELLLQYLTHSERVGRCKAKEELKTYTKGESKESLTFLLALMRGPQRKANNLLDKLKFGMEEQVELIEKCLIECDMKGDVVSVTASKILSCVPEPSVLESTGHSDAARIIRALTGLLQGLEIMNTYGVSLRVAEMKASMESREESEKKLIRLVLKATTAPHASRWKLPEWVNFQSEVLTLRDQVFTLVSAERCMEIFVRGLLSSGSHSTILMARNFCDDPEDEGEETKPDVLQLNIDAASAQISAAAEDYIHGASRFKDEEITLAVQCLTSVLSSRQPEFTKLLNVISGISLLEEMKVTELPSRILMSTDRSRFLQLALEVDPKNYKDAKKLLKIGNLLDCFASGSGAQRAEILRLCTRKALDMLDYRTASKYCQELIASRNPVAWDVCFELATSGECESQQLTLELCRFVLLHAPQSYLSETLQHQLQLKHDSFQSSLNLQSDDLSNEECLSKLIAELHTVDRFAWDAGLDPIYAAKYSDTRDEAPIEPKFLDLQKRFASEPNSPTGPVKELLLRLAKDVLGFSSSWGLALLLAMRDAEETERLLRSCPNPPLAYAALLYISALQLTAWNLPQVWELEPKAVVDLVVKERRRFGENAWKQLLVRLVEDGPWDEEGRTTKSLETNPEADLRFVKDPQYRKDTILGISMTLDDDAFVRACSLAKEFKLDVWEVAMSSLEFLLTTPEHSVSEIADRIKGRRLPSILGAKPDRLRDAMASSILPLIDGKDHSRLVLYYMTLEKSSLNSPNFAKQAQLHRTLIRHFSKISKDIDYKKLATHQNLIPTLNGILTSSNASSLSKLIVKIPGAGYTAGEIDLATAVAKCIEATEKGGVEEFTDCLKAQCEQIGETDRWQLLRAVETHSDLFRDFEKEVAETARQLLDEDDRASIDGDEEEELADKKADSEPSSISDTKVDSQQDGPEVDQVPEPETKSPPSFALPDPLATFSNYGLVRRRKS